MRSMMEILNLVLDKQITTKEQAAALIDWEVSEMMTHRNMSQDEEKEARKKLLESIARVTRYLSHKQANNVTELFGIESKKEND